MARLRAGFESNPAANGRKRNVRSIASSPRGVGNTARGSREQVRTLHVMIAPDRRDDQCQWKRFHVTYGT
jgi:hypothetical protein